MSKTSAAPDRWPLLFRHWIGIMVIWADLRPKDRGMAVSAAGRPMVHSNTLPPIQSRLQHYDQAPNKVRVSCPSQPYHTHSCLGMAALSDRSLGSRVFEIANAMSTVRCSLPGGGSRITSTHLRLSFVPITIVPLHHDRDFPANRLCQWFCCGFCVFADSMAVAASGSASSLAALMWLTAIGHC